MNILIKLSCLVGLTLAPLLAINANHGATTGTNGCCEPKTEMACCHGDSAMTMNAKCDMKACAHMTKEECAAMCDSMKCTPEEKAFCMNHAGVCTMGADGKCEGKCMTQASGHSCMAGCDKGCKTDEECKKNCGDKCKMH
jgi:hypothetical protein